MPKHIEIVACSAEGAVICYRTLCSETPALMGEYIPRSVYTYLPVGSVHDSHPFRKLGRSRVIDVILCDKACRYRSRK